MYFFLLKKYFVYFYSFFLTNDKKIGNNKNINIDWNLEKILKIKKNPI